MIGIMSEECVLHCGCYPALADSAADLKRDRDKLRTALSKLRRTHLDVEEDCWFSCPKSGHCCNDEVPKDVCICGADKANAVIDEALGIE